jgi:serine/threonine protein kinase/outer membrane protein assembly factor BamB
MAGLLLTGDKLENGHYTVISEVGVGGMGIVYRCRDELLLRDVAIKILLPELTTNRRNHEVFWQEARLAAQLEHPNIVTIYDIGVEDRQGKPHYYLAMEFLPGGNLAKRLNRGALPLEQCLNWMQQLAAGLGFAHKRGVVHQDIKSDNIFITKAGDLKIGDFGLAKLLVGKVHYNAGTKGLGTPAYMSPELCRGDAQDHRSDIYSLGVLFFEMATGQLPFQASGMIEMAMKHSNAPVPSARRINAEIPEPLDRMIRKMMYKTADGRYQTTMDILGVVEELIFERRMSNRGLREAAAAERESPPAPKKAGRKKAAKTADKLPSVERLVVTLKDGSAGKAPSDAKARPGSTAIASVTPTPPTSMRLSPAVHRSSMTPAQRISGAKPTEFLSVKGLAALDLRWTFKSNGPIGWSASPVMDEEEEVLYVASADGYLYALAADSGECLWSYLTGAPIVAAPSITEDKVVVVSANGTVSAVSVDDGSVQWTFKSNRTVVATPLVHDDLIVIAGFDGHIQAISHKDGKEGWQQDLKEPVAAQLEARGRQIFLGTKAGSFFSVDASTGERIWNHRAEGAIVSGSTVSANSVFFGTKRGVFQALMTETGQLIWQNDTERPITSRNVVFFDSVLFANQNKTLYCLSRDSGELLWRSGVRGTTLANLLLHGDSVLTASREGWLQSFALDTGEVQWQRELGRCLEATPLLTATMMFVPTVEGDVLAYSFTEAGLAPS